MHAWNAAAREEVARPGRSRMVSKALSILRSILPSCLINHGRNSSGERREKQKEQSAPIEVDSAHCREWIADGGAGDEKSRGARRVERPWQANVRRRLQSP